MTPAQVSVIVVSRGRPGPLALCLAALDQQTLDRFEVVVVADPAGLAVVQGPRWAGRIKSVAFDIPNISQARNLGLAAAAGQIVAFVDDDAVAEPTWLRHLTAPFADPDVSAAGGYVRGRNGISFQWTAEWADRLGRAHALKLDPEIPHVLPGTPEQAIKTQGTNMAFRRALLAEMGGFDPAYRYYLDETDLNRRLADRGARTAIVPPAQVHHGYAANAYRKTDRAPRSLHEIGASLAVFLRKHAAPADHAAGYADLRQAQRRRLLRHMVSGGIEPRDIRRLLADLEAGFRAGQERALGDLAPIPEPQAPFLPFAHRPPTEAVTKTGWLWQLGRLTDEGRRERASNRICTVFALSPSHRRHWVRFTDDGLWLHRGGLWGRSDRDRPAPRGGGLAARVRREAARIAPQRAVEPSETPADRAESGVSDP